MTKLGPPKMRRIRRPPLWQYLLDIFVQNDGTFCGRLLPLDPCWNSPIKKARASGWIRRGNLGFAMAGDRRKPTDRQNFIWRLTPLGEEEAKKATAAISAYKTEVKIASAEWRIAFAKWNDENDHHLAQD